MKHPNTVEDCDSATSFSFDDPVPPGSEDSVVMGGVRHQHLLAEDIQRVLQRLPGVVVDSLVVRELADGGVILEGSVRASSRSPNDLSAPVREATGSDRVIDRLRVQRTSALDETLTDQSRDAAQKG